jgi:Helicase conserved C-terminal domain
VAAINALSLPRYGLANYVAATPHKPPTQNEAKHLLDLSRAGKRLMGFCRTNLFKRLESCGEAFQQSIQRHILRNHIFLHAVEQGLPLPIGTQDSGLLDAGNYDEDADDVNAEAGVLDDDEAENKPSSTVDLRTAADFKTRAAQIYGAYASQFKTRFKWLRPDLFVKSLSNDLERDAECLLKVLKRAGDWNPAKDAKLNALEALLTKRHSNEKVIIFTQFADTVRYLEHELRQRGVESVAGVTGQSEDPTASAWRFSPVSNNRRTQINPSDELRVLVATDVLSEGQNLQDAAIIVNFDLPWAIIRLIQRAGRVDRIGQRADTILCYSFLPADGVENLIRLRSRVRQRLRENAEVIGTDEAFFEDEKEKQKLLDLYNEKAGILDGDDDREVDLASYAYQIWKNAVDRDPTLQKTIPELASMVYSTKHHEPLPNKPPGVLVYLRTAEGNDALAWVRKDGESVTESQFEILRAAECPPETAALPRMDQHHLLVRKGVEKIVAEEKSVGGQLGRPSGARFRTYERLKRYADSVKGTLFDIPQLAKTIEEVYRFPLRQSAVDTLNRQLRAGVLDEKLAELAMALREDDRLCIVHEEEQTQEPQIICSMGLAGENGEG